MKAAIFDGFQSYMALPTPPAAPQAPQAPHTVSTTAGGAASNASPVTVVGERCVLTGNWNVQALAIKGEVGRRRQALAAARSSSPSIAWDLSGIGMLDAVGAQLLWQYWDQKIPAGTQLTPGQQALFEILADHPIDGVPPKPPTDWLAWVRAIGVGVFVTLEHGQKLLLLLGGFVLDFAKFLRHPVRGPWREISAQI